MVAVTHIARCYVGIRLNFHCCNTITMKGLRAEITTQEIRTQTLFTSSWMSLLSSSLPALSAIVSNAFAKRDVWLDQWILQI